MIETTPDRVDEFIWEQMRRRRIPGLALGIVHDRVVVKQQAYGLASVELNVPATTKTVFRLASLTKIFTATAVMALVEQGAISLDDSITTILPELPPAWCDVTIRHCLAHASGLPDAVNAHERPIAYTLEDVLRLLAEAPRATPGTANRYNQTGYLVLGMIVERLTGMGFEAFIEQQFLRPLGMQDSAFGDDRDIVKGRTSMYTVLEPSDDRLDIRYQEEGPVVSQDKIYATSVYVYPRFEFACAGLNCSIEDLVNWDLALSSGRVLAPGSVEAMAAGFPLTNGESSHFGAGWIAGRMGPHRAMAFGGGGATWHLRLLDQGISVIVLANLQRSRPDEIAEGVASLCLPD